MPGPATYNPVMRPTLGGWVGVRRNVPVSSSEPVATALVFTTQPGDAEEDLPFGQQPVVQVRDQFGDPFDYMGDMTIVKLSGPGTLSGDNVVPVSAGSAAFGELEVDTAGTYVLRASIASPALHVDSASFEVAASDPLAGFSWQGRWQTHIGDNVPLGLYQDVACTVPATEDFDPVAAFRDELTGSGRVFTQADEAKQPYLFFEDGVPTVIGDGVDDIMSLSNMGNLTDTGTFFVGQRADSAAQTGTTLSSTGSRIRLFAPFSSLMIFDWGTGGGAGRIFDAFTDTGWNVIEALKNSATPTQYLKLNGSAFASGSNASDVAAANAAFTLFGAGSEFLAAGITSVCFSNSDLGANESTVNTYLATLNP